MKFPDLLEDILKLPYYPSDEYIDMLKVVHNAAWLLECSGRTKESQYLLKFLIKDWEEWYGEYDYIIEEQKEINEFKNWSKDKLINEVIRLRRVETSS